MSRKSQKLNRTVHMPKKPVTTHAVQPVTRTELEAELVRQEHLTLKILLNYFWSYSSRHYAIDDARLEAAGEAFWRRLFWSFIPGAGGGGAGWLALLTVIVAVWANGLLSDQNKTLEAQTELMKSQSAQLAAQNKLIEQQSSLLNTQTQHITRQTELSDAARRSGIMNEMSAIFDTVSQYIAEQEAAGKRRPANGWTLPESVYARIIAACNACVSYRTVRHLRADGRSTGTAMYEDKLHSPERAHMLAFILEMGIEATTIFERASFESVWLDNARGKTLRGIEMHHGDMRYTQAQGADLRDARLSFTDWTYDSLEGADLRGAELARATLDGTKLMRANLTDATLAEAVVRGANLLDANLTRCDLRKTDFTGSILTQVNFESAVVDRSDWIEATAQQAQSGFHSSEWRVEPTPGRLEDGQVVLPAFVVKRR